jgi:hypothetical protein
MLRKLLVWALGIAMLPLAARAEVLVDSGFRPSPDGFSFANWGGDEHPIAELTPDDAAYLFGEEACARFEDQSCVPTPGARLWLKEMNASKGGGHCEGMAVLSAAFFIRAEDVSEYGASKAVALKPNDEILMRTISTYFSTQALEPVQSVTNETKEFSLQEIVDSLTAALKSGDDYPTLGIYDTAGGHAVTPYKIERTGNARYRVYIYDNNYPGAEKYIDIDAAADSWIYDGAALNPSEPANPWKGGAGSMDFTLVSTRFEPLQCPFCGPEDQRAAAAEARAGGGQQARPKRPPAVPATSYTVMTPSPCNLVKALGKNNQPAAGASMRPMRGTRGCVVSLPRDQPYNVQLSGNTGSSSMTVFGGGKVFQVDNIALRPGDIEALSFDGGDFDYRAGGDQRPTIRFADDNAETDSFYEISDFGLGEGHAFSADEDESGRIAFSDDDPELDDYDIDAELIGEDGTRSFAFADVGAGDDGELLFDDEGGSLDLDIDSDGDGDADVEDVRGDDGDESADEADDGEVSEDEFADEGADDGDMSEEDGSDEADEGSAETGDEGLDESDDGGDESGMSEDEGSDEFDESSDEAGDDGLDESDDAGDEGFDGSDEGLDESDEGLDESDEGLDESDVGDDESDDEGDDESTEEDLDESEDE